MRVRPTDEQQLIEQLARGERAYKVLAWAQRARLSTPLGQLLWRVFRAGKSQRLWEDDFVTELVRAGEPVTEDDVLGLLHQADSAWQSEPEAFRARWSAPLPGLSSAWQRLLGAVPAPERLVPRLRELDEPFRSSLAFGLALRGALPPENLEEEPLLRAVATVYVDELFPKEHLEALFPTERFAHALRLASQRPPSRPWRRRLFWAARALPNATPEELVRALSFTEESCAGQAFSLLIARGEPVVPALTEELAKLDAPDAGNDTEWALAVTAALVQLSPGVVSALEQRVATLFASPCRSAFEALRVLAPWSTPSQLVTRALTLPVLEGIRLLEGRGAEVLEALAHTAVEGAEAAALITSVGLGRGGTNVADLSDARLATALRWSVENDLDCPCWRPRPARALDHVKDPRLLLGDVLAGLPLARREALLLQPRAPMFYLSACPTPAIAARVIEVALEDNGTTGYRVVIAAVLRALGPVAREALREALAKTRKVPLRDTLVRALAALRDPSAAPTLERQLEQPEPDVAKAARQGLVGLGREEELACEATLRSLRASSEPQAGKALQELADELRPRGGSNVVWSSSTERARKLERAANRLEALPRDDVAIAELCGLAEALTDANERFPAELLTMFEWLSPRWSRSDAYPHALELLLDGAEPAHATQLLAAARPLLGSALGPVVHSVLVRARSLGERAPLLEALAASKHPGAAALFTRGLKDRSRKARALCQRLLAAL